MNARPSVRDIELFLSYAAANLPDSFTDRKIYLVTLASLLPRGEQRAKILLLLEHLRAHESAQLKLFAR